MRNLVYEIREDEVLLDNYYDLNCVEEVVIFSEWLKDMGALGNWSRLQMGENGWLKTAKMSGAKKLIILSKRAISLQ